MQAFVCETHDKFESAKNWVRHETRNLATTKEQKTKDKKGWKKLKNDGATFSCFALRNN
jgi:hypothetical protein